MSGAFANEDVMEEYLTALLSEEGAVADVDELQRQSVARLLERAEPKKEIEKQEVATPPPVEKIKDTFAEADITEEQPEEIVVGSEVQVAESEYRQGSFQALFFTVAGLTMAVPLTELGGIHQLDKVQPLFGKPDWFKGVMLYRDEKLNVVDSARWVMPEKYDEKLAESLNYQYLIMLDESGWGLACESLINTVTLEQDDVKWREAEGKRPWLAGLVKKEMCALVDVKQLVRLLEQGMGSNDE